MKLLENTKEECKILSSIENIEYEDAITIKDFFSRVWEFLDDIKEKYSDKNILIVTHNGVCRAIASYFKGITENGDVNLYGHANCEVREYEM